VTARCAIRAVFALAACSALPLHAQPLERLFFTPEERRSIEAQRRGATHPEAVTAARPPVRKVHGAIAAGTRGVAGWMDGRKLEEADRIDDFVVRFSADGARLTRPGRAPLEVPVGAGVDTASGRVAADVAVARGAARRER
jgi:hypothetical protein